MSEPSFTSEHLLKSFNETDLPRIWFFYSKMDWQRFEHYAYEENDKYDHDELNEI